MIENEIVKMQFDNASFEKNAKESMSTLEKLKAALRFDKVDMTPLQKAFADAEATATKAGLNIRDIWIKVASKIEDEVATKIVNAGKKMMNALTFEGINDGFKEYELKMGSIQTIMAGTGESLATVNKYLDELNTYSDKTIYSFADMTNNIGKFTNAGVKLDDAVNAIKGIANEAAVSGANANEASRAMYNFSQALSAGYVKLIDWKSIENANMATKEFKDTLLEMASAVGTVEKAEDGMYKVLTSNANGGTMSELVSGTKNFNDSLQFQWMTTEVLTKTLKLYATDIRELNEEEKALYETELKGLGLTEEQIKKFEDLGIKATNSASEIKTFTMLMDTLKEAIGSGWAMSWQIMIGDFEQAKALWTDVGNTLSNVIDNLSEARNNFLKQGLRSGWEKTIAGGGLEDVIPDAEKFKNLLVELAHNQGILNDEEFESIDSTEKFLKSLHSAQWMSGKLLKEAVDDYTNILKSMTEEELKEAGFSDVDILRLEKFGNKLKDTKGYADDLAKSMNDLGGRENVIQGLKNVFGSLLNVLKPIRDSFNETFGTLDPDRLYELTRRFRQFTEQLLVSEDASNTLKTSFDLAFGGVKAIINGVYIVFKGLGKTVLPLLNLFDAVFGLIGKTISALTGSSSITKAANKFTKFGDKVGNKYLAIMQKLANTINKIANAIRNLPDSKGIILLRKAFEKARTSVKDFLKAFVDIPIVKEMVEDFNKTVDAVGKKIKEVKEIVDRYLKRFEESFKRTFNFENLNKTITFIYRSGKNFIKLIKDLDKRFKSFFKDLKKGKKISDAFMDNFGSIIERIKNLKDVVTEFFDKVTSKLGTTDIKDRMESVAKAIHEFVKNITPEQITMLAIAITFMAIAINLLRLSGALQDALEAFTGIGSAIKRVINSYVKKQKSVVLQVAESIVLVASALWVLSTVPKEKLKSALITVSITAGLIAALTGVLTLCGIAMAKLGDKKSLVELATGMVIVTSSFMVAALSLKVLETVNLDGILKKLVVLAGIMFALTILSEIISKFDKFGKGALTMLAVSGSLLLVSDSLLKLGQIPKEQLKTAMDSMLKMMIGLSAIVFAAGHIGVFSAVGLIAVIFSMSRIMPMMEKIVNYDYTNIENGLKKNLKVMEQLSGVILAIIGVGALAGNRLKGASAAILSITIALAGMVGIVKLIGLLKQSELDKGKDFIFNMAIVIGALELCARKAEEGNKKTSGYKGLLRIPIAMGALLLVVKLASMVETKDLIKGELAVLGLTGILSAMLVVAGLSSKSEDAFKNVSKMLFLVSMILAEVSLLSMIPTNKMAPALGSVLAIVISLAVLSAAIAKNMSRTVTYSKATQKITKNSTQLLLIGAFVMILALGSLVSALADKAPKNVAASAASLIGIILATAGLISVVASSMKKMSGVTVDKNQWQIVFMSIGVIAVLSAVLSAMTYVMKRYNLNGSDMLSSAGALAIALTGLSVAIAAMEKFKGNRNVRNIAKAVGASIGVLIVLASAIAGLSYLTKSGINSNDIIKSSLALSIGLIGISAPITILGAVGRLCKGLQLKNLSAIVLSAILVVASVGTAIGVLSRFADADKLVTSATALSIALMGISVAIAVLGAVGKFAKDIKFSTAVILVSGALVSLGSVAFILYEFSKNIDMSSIEKINAVIPSLIIVMGTLSVLMLAIAAAGRIAKNAKFALVGGLVLVEAIIGVGLIVGAVVGLGALLGQLGDEEANVMNGIDILVRIIGKIGEMIGAFIGGFGVGLSNGLPMIADNLVSFSEKMIIFSENIKQVSPESIGIIAELSGALLLLTGAEFVSGITDAIPIFKLFKNDNPFEALGKAVAGFCESVKDIPEDSVSKASILADVVSKLAPLTGINFGEFINKLVFGEGSMESFSEGLEAFGSAIVKFCEGVREVTDEDTAAAQRAADATGPMIEIAKQIPATGGWAQTILGSQDIGLFGESIAAFAGCMVTLAEKLKELEATDPDYSAKITKCAESVQPLIDLTNEIDRFGGSIEKIIGSTSLDKFGETLPPFAEDLKTFIIKIKELRKEDPLYKTHISDVATATDSLVTVANGIEAMGGIFSKGENSLKTFGSQLKSFGESFKTFDEKLSGIDLERVNNSILTITDLVALANDAKSVENTSFNGFKEALNDLSSSPISEIAVAIDTNTPTILASFKGLFDTIISHIRYRTPLDVLVFNGYGISIIKGLEDGFTTQFVVFRSVFITKISSINSTLKNTLPVRSFVDHGRDIVLGLAEGIKNNAGTAIDAAKNLAKEVNEAFQVALDIHSPSKITYDFGKNYVLGFKNGIDNYSSLAIESTEELSSDIINTANSIISRINDVIEGDIDAQPTITPVLDTSDIAKKAKSINKIFSGSDLQLAYKVSNSINGAYYNKGESRYYDNARENEMSRNISFVQNNYSPKSLDRYEIYRQTKNQISQLKGVL